MDSIAAAFLIEEEGNASDNAVARIERRRLRDMCNPFEMSDELFKKNFRLNKDAFKYVLDTFVVEAPASTSTTLSPLNRVVAALRFFAEGSYQHGVGADYNVGMGQSTVSKTLSNFLDIMEHKLCREWIHFDQTEEEKTQAKQEFYAKAGFPGVIMCVDDMPFYSRNIRRILDNWPGKKRFGVYRFLPLFFLLGAALEFSMINWTVGETNFYHTFKKRQAKNFVEDKLKTAQEQVQVPAKESA